MAVSERPDPSIVRISTIAANKPEHRSESPTMSDHSDVNISFEIPEIDEPVSSHKWKPWTVI